MRADFDTGQGRAVQTASPAGQDGSVPTPLGVVDPEQVTDPGDIFDDEWSTISRAQDGDLRAFETLVDRYQGPLFRLAWRMLADRGEAEDVVQETLITAWRRLPVLSSPRAFASWVFRVASNRCLDVLRRRASRRTDVVGDDTLTQLATGGEQPATTAEFRAEQNEVARLLGTLTDDQRACWLLREVHGRSYAEIATILGVTETTVRGRLARARTQLAEGMQSWR